MTIRSDPYAVLGIRPSATDTELRAAYRKMVKLHHPDHNGGSLEAQARFEAVQGAYAEVLQLRAAAAVRAPHAAFRPEPARAQSGGSEMDARIAAMEREITERRARERARLRAEEEQRQARAAAARSTATDKLGRASREELGYVDEPDDSFSSILADALDQVAERLGSKRRGQ